MTGSRVKTPIIDLPYTVNVLTSEFFEDFGIFELSDNVTQVGSFTGLDIGGNFNLRGFTSSNQLRDGFFRLGRYGSSNIDRMEIIKGSNAAIYGRSSPGGMVNMISKAPRAETAQKLSFNLGDYGTKRGTLEATGTVRPGTAYVLTAGYYERDFGQAFARNRNQEYYLALAHTFADRSKLTLQAEYFLQERRSPLAPLPLVVDQKGTTATTDDVAVGYALPLGGLSAYGPNSELNRGNVSLTAVYEKVFNPTWSLRTSGNLYQARRWDYNQNTGWGQVAINRPGGLASTTQRGATPNRTRIFEDGGGFQADLLAQYRLGRGVEHRTLLTLDINDYYRWDPTLGFGGAANPDIVAWNAVRTVTLGADLLPVAPVGYFPKWYWESAGETTTRLRKYRTTVVGGSVRHQTALLGGRLLAYAGGRYDNVRWRHRDVLTAIPGYALGQLIDRSEGTLTPNLGLNFKVTPTFRAFVNYSESYFVAQGITPAEIADPTFRTETADGYDFGFKGALFDDRLSFTVSGFDINRYNVRVTDIEESPAGSGNFVQVSRPDGNQKVRGWELDVNWRLTADLSLLGSYGRVDSTYTDFGSAFPAAVGRQVAFIAPHNGSVSAKYAPRDGALKGFSFNAGVTWVGATPTEQPNAGDTYATVGGQRVVTSSTGAWALRTPAYSLVSAGVRYTARARGSRSSHTFGVTVNNLLDEDYFRTGASANNRLLGEERAIFFTYTLAHKGAF
jgi:outer membrane receptor protein involved in Fe transport